MPSNPQRFIQPVRWRRIGAYLLAGQLLLGLVLLIPVLVSLLSREFEYSILIGIPCVVLLGVGGVGARILRRTPELEPREALLVTALFYLLFALVGAIAFLPKMSYLNAVFESMSGFTTTGLSVASVDSLPTTLLFFRSFAQWVGGAGIVVLSMVILARPGGMALRLFASEYGEENLLGNVKATARVVFQIYFVLTVAAILAFWAAGMEPFAALLHAFSTLSTGGFSPYSDSIGHYRSVPIELTTVVFMWLGAISFPLWYFARRGNLRRLFTDVQTRYLIVITLLGSLVFLGGLGFTLRHASSSLFQAASTLSTTGFSTLNQAALSPASRWATILMMILGGTTGSTAGGIKLFRFIALLGAVRWLFLRAMLPEGSILAIKAGEEEIDEERLRMISAYVVLYVGLLGLGALVLMLSGYSLSASIFEAASAQGTVGLSVGVTSPTMPTGAKLMLLVQMWIGRLEIVPILLLLTPSMWWKRGRTSRNERKARTP